MEKIPNIDQNQEKTKPEEALKYMMKLGEDISYNTKKTLAMLEEGKARNIEVDISNNETFAKFEPRGEYENQLIRIRDELNVVGGELFKQGIKMTLDDLNKRLELMK